MPLAEYGQKECSKCRCVLSVGQFPASKQTRDGLYGWCRACHSQRGCEEAKRDRRKRNAQARAWRVKSGRRASEHSVRHARKRLYGISGERYDAMFEAQAGVCAVCGCPETKTRRGGVIFALSVDHDHVTGKVRALLCSGCNQALGMLRDDPKRIRALADYVDLHKGEESGLT